MTPKPYIAQTVPTTLQECFDIIWERAKDLTRCVSENERRRYRNEKGEACFIGALIPEELYDPAIEGKGLNDKRVVLPKSLEMFRDKLKRLQDIHDAAAPQSWRQRLRDAADDFGLTVPAGESAGAQA